nr:MAG TPA: Ribosomal protein S27 [Caudoviricetes sp.]
MDILEIVCVKCGNEQMAMDLAQQKVDNGK